MGQSLLSDFENSSCKAIKEVIDGTVETYPNIWLPTVDVRDVAQAHITAALEPKFATRNDRFMMSDKSLSYEEIIHSIHQIQKLKKKPRKVGYMTLKIASMFNSDL